MLFDGLPILRRRMIWLGLAPSLLVLAAATTMFARSTNAAEIAAYTLADLLAIAWCFYLRGRLRLKGRRVMVRTRGMTCVRCDYPLTGVGESGNCPECGTSFYAEHTQACWAHAAGFP